MSFTNENINISYFTSSKTSISEFKFIIRDIARNPNVLDLRKYVQHLYSSRYSHCFKVSFYTYIICKKLNLDYISAVRGAMLHDFYFYDWLNEKKKFHLFRHPKIALSNACNIFILNDLEKDIIIKHMWPLTIRFPKYLESFIVTCTDKYCATCEILRFIKIKYKNFKKYNNIF